MTGKDIIPASLPDWWKGQGHGVVMCEIDNGVCHICHAIISSSNVTWYIIGIVTNITNPDNENEIMFHTYRVSQKGAYNILRASSIEVLECRVTSGIEDILAKEPPKGWTFTPRYTVSRQPQLPDQRTK